MEFDDKPMEISRVDRRRDSRFCVHAPVEITNLRQGVGRTAERTVIDDVGDFGCRFSLHEPAQPGDILAIKLLAEDGTSPLDLPAKLFEVIWVAQGAEKSSVGARAFEGE